MKNTTYNTLENINVLTFPVAAPYDVVYRNNRIDHPVGPHSHNAVELYYTLSDLPDVLLNDTVLAVPAGTLIIIPPFCVHQLYHESGKTYERYILSIHNQWLSGVFCNRTDAFSFLNESHSPLLLPLNPVRNNPWTKELDRLLSFPEQTLPETMSCFFQLLTHLNQMVAELAPENKPGFSISGAQKNVNEMISYIHEHIYENISVNDLANRFYLNPDYLSRLFKKHTHVSVNRYISLQKIATAQSLLREGYTVAWVQEKLSFSSYAYFFKIFQKIAGISPSKYREQYLKS